MDKNRFTHRVAWGAGCRILSIFFLMFAALPALAQDKCAAFSIKTALGVDIWGKYVETGDGPMCVFFRFQTNQPVGVDSHGYFTKANVNRLSCPEGRLRGSLCYLRPTPETGFIYENAFHAGQVDGTCPADMIFDGVNCFWRKAAAGTMPVVKDGGWYTTAKASCLVSKPNGFGDDVLGAYDGTVCRIADTDHLPTAAIILQQPDGAYAAMPMPLE